MTKDKPKKDAKDLSDWEPVHDSIGVTHLGQLKSLLLSSVVGARIND